MKQNLVKDAQIQYGGVAVANASNTDSNSSRFDLANWEGIVFLTTLTDCAATGVATLTAEGNTIDSDTGMAAISGASAAKTCAVNDDLNGTTLIVDVYRPQKRYVQGVRVSATANIAFGEIIAILYGPKKKPVAAGSTNSTQTFVTG